MKKIIITLQQALLLAGGLLSSYSIALANDVPLIPDYDNEADISDVRQEEYS
mgnify:CR=1 FL=1